MLAGGVAREESSFTLLLPTLLLSWLFIVVGLGVLSRVDEFVVNAIVQLSIVIDFILPILVSAPRCKFKNVLLRLHWRHLENRFEELVDV